jgi:hypothetical protein
MTTDFTPNLAKQRQIKRCEKTNANVFQSILGKSIVLSADHINVSPH